MWSVVVFVIKHLFHMEGGTAVCVIPITELGNSYSYILVSVCSQNNVKIIYVAAAEKEAPFDGFYATTFQS